MLRPILLAALLPVITFTDVDAQSSDAQEVIVEGIDYLRRELGDSTVVDSRIRDDVKVKLTERGIVLRLATDRLQCPADRSPYYVGTERYVAHHDPLISGASASLRVFWTYTPAGTRYYVGETQLLQLQKVNGRWTVTGTAEKDYMDVYPSDCLKK